MKYKCTLYTYVIYYNYYKLSNRNKCSEFKTIYNMNNKINHVKCEKGNNYDLGIH